MRDGVACHSTLAAVTSFKGHLLFHSRTFLSLKYQPVEENRAKNRLMAQFWDFIFPLLLQPSPGSRYLEAGSSSKLPPTDRRSELNIGQFVSFIEVLVQQASRRLLHVDLSCHPRTFRWKLPDKGH